MCPVGRLCVSWDLPGATKGSLVGVNGASPGPEGQRCHQGALGARAQLSAGPEHGITSSSDTSRSTEGPEPASHLGIHAWTFQVHSRKQSSSDFLQKPTLSPVFSQFLDMFGRDTGGTHKLIN